MGTPQQLSYFQPIQFCLESHIIARVKTSKYLGVTLDTNLSWTSHVDKLHSKVSSRIGVLKRIKLSLTFQRPNVCVIQLSCHCLTTVM